MSENKVVEKKATKFLSCLRASNAEIADKRGSRWNRMSVSESEQILAKKQATVDRLQEAIDNHTDISTSNDLQTANRIGEFKAQEFTTRLHELEYDLAIAEDELKIAKRTHEKWFGNDDLS